MIKSAPLLVIIHLAAWLLFLSLIVTFITTSSESNNIIHLLITPQLFFFSAVYIFLFYLNSYYLIPNIYFQKRYILYFFIVLVLFVAVYYLKPFEQLFLLRRQSLSNAALPDMPAMPPGGRPGPPPGDMIGLPGNEMRPPRSGEPGGRREHADIVSLILFAMIWSISWASQLVKQWRYVEERAARAEADKAHAELSFLKAQVNPHFLFNTLNNIYSLAVSKNENTAASIMKLSNIMRYVTDEVSQDFVALENEIGFIQNYIELQRLRLNSKVQLSFEVRGNVEGKKIAPLILMPFIENIFKYGISNHEPSDILIQLFAEEKKLVFFCRNKIFATARQEERAGIGIENTRLRLQHLYPDSHSLTILADKELYRVELSLQL